MRKTSFLPLLSITAGLAVCLSTFFFFTGCESADSYTIEVSANRSDVTSSDREVLLTASGWSEYTWSLESENIGYLSSTHGESVIYTATEFPTNDTLQTITVKTKGVVETITSSDESNTTSRSSAIYTGQVFVRHRSD